MTSPQCLVVGCGSSAYGDPYELVSMQQGFGAYVSVCPLHRGDLDKPETEWMLVRDEGKLYVGDSLRNLNEYVVLGVEGITGYGTAREFSHNDDNGNHLKVRVRRRGDKEKEMILVVPSMEIAKELKDWIGYLPSD